MQPSVAPASRESGQAAPGGIAPEVLARLSAANDPAVFAAAWLDAVASLTDGMQQGLVVLAAMRGGRNEPVAAWPSNVVPDPGLLAAVDGAVRGGRMVVQTVEARRNAAETAPLLAIGYPVTVAGRVRGAAGLLLASDAENPQVVIDRIAWGCGWIEALLRRRTVSLGDRIGTVVELLATGLHHNRFQEAATAVATELAGVFGCERVSIGFRNKNHVKLSALSNSAAFGKRANLVRALELAMDESIDQQTIIVIPAVEGQELVVRAHQALSREHGQNTICTVPLTENNRVLGAITLERPTDKPFDPPSIQLCEHIGVLLGPVLELKRKEDRWIGRKVLDSVTTFVRNLVGPRHVALKLGAITAVAVAAFLLFARGDYRVTADGSLEGTIQRALAAPVAGYLSDAQSRAGDLVKAGQVMATLDDRDLRLERLKWATQRAKQQREYSEALAKQELAKAQVLRTQIEQADAQLTLLDEQISRLKITAPFDGVIVSGDLSQQLGAPVERGNVLFEVAPLKAYRIVLKVDERDIVGITLGLSGELVLSSMPDRGVPFLIEKITPISTAQEGRNFYRVEARPTGDDTEALRPGMQGVAKIVVDRRRLAWIWSHKVVHWLRMFLWSWWP
ncbi:HlyD family efflux transporter periplasmic adaptor subunit [Rhodoplanes sp. Z2-YC6860]|uniref:HlyD family efflux transporter periplasmic adaptor subunit n=1 Tax=Rhodoplanes sp. Z2-YC6860 TaxID=674703 RepID=UPI00078E2BCC|nr:HlyD family efflux transporter periplasmic adaptor subunit [Rhodoplanes sp. Z2-YC6860]AMN41143.1 TonB-dependent siderophore receptor [Rhodoplanes sp. Z2-YC6860]